MNSLATHSAPPSGRPNYPLTIYQETTPANNEQTMAQLRPRICLLVCEQDTSIDGVRFHELKKLMSPDLQRNFSTTVSAFEPCHIFKTPLETPVPFGIYRHGDTVEWSDALPFKSSIRQRLVGPFEVWSATYFADKHQGVILDVPGETDDSFICEVSCDPVLQQKELVLVDWQTEVILIAPPGFFRHYQKK